MNTTDNSSQQKNKKVQLLEDGGIHCNIEVGMALLKNYEQNNTYV